jgi:hypothetical protein
MCSCPPPPPSEDIPPKAFRSNKTATATRQINRTSQNSGAALSRVLRNSCSLNIWAQKTRPCGSVESAAKTATKLTTLSTSGIRPPRFKARYWRRDAWNTSQRSYRVQTSDPSRSVLHPITRPALAIGDTGFRVHPRHSQALSTRTTRPHGHSTENTVSSCCNAVQ